MPAKVLIAPTGSVEAQCAARALCGAGVHATATPTADAQAVVWFDTPGSTPAAASVDSGHPDRPTLLVSPRVDADAIRLAEEMGAAGLVGWSSATDVLVEAIGHLVDGRSTLPTPPANRDDPLQQLTDRELEIVRMLGEGATNAAIATSLDISYHTVRTHVAHVLGKLGVSHRYAVAALACQSARLVALTAAAGRASA